MISYALNALIDMGEILFSREKVPQNASKNKLVPKNDVGLIWELLASTRGYGLLVFPKAKREERSFTGDEREARVRDDGNQRNKRAWSDGKEK